MTAAVRSANGSVRLLRIDAPALRSVGYLAALKKDVPAPARSLAVRTPTPLKE